jgi:hypothetical protein
MNIGKFLAGGGAVMRGMDQANDEASARSYLDAVRTGSLEQQGLNLEEARAVGADRRRERTTTDSIRLAAQGVEAQRADVQRSNAAATAARSDPLGGIGASTQGLDGYDPPPMKPEPGRLQSLSAMRDAAAKAGDVTKAAEFDKAMAALKAEGITDAVKAMMSGAEASEVEKIFNAAGAMRVVPGSLRFSADGNAIATNAETGQPIKPFNVPKMAVLLGLVKPDEYASAGDGQTFNKRTGQVVGTRVLKPGETMVGPGGVPVGQQVPFAPKDLAVVVPEGSSVTTLGPNGAPLSSAGGDSAPVNGKIRKEISDEIDAGYKGAMGELTGTAAVRDKAKVLGNNLYAANKDPDKGMTPQLAATIARQVAEGSLKPKQATDASGNVWNVVEYEGKLYPIERQPAAKEGAPQGRGGAAIEPPAQAIEFLKKNPDQAAAFQQKYGIDPQKYLSKPAAPTAKAPTPAPTTAQAARGGVAKQAPAPATAANGKEPDWAAIPEPPNTGPTGTNRAEFDAWNEKWGDLWREKQDRIKGMVGSSYAASGAEADKRYSDAALSKRATQK